MYSLAGISVKFQCHLAASTSSGSNPLVKTAYAITVVAQPDLNSALHIALPHWRVTAGVLHSATPYAGLAVAAPTRSGTVAELVAEIKR